MGVRSTPGCSPSSFSSIVEAGRLFSCQPPSPSVPPSSPSPLLPPSLPHPPPSSCSASSLHEFMEAHTSGCPLPGPAGDPSPQSAHFFPISIARPKYSYLRPVLVTNPNVSICSWLFSEADLANGFLHFLVRPLCALFSPSHVLYYIGIILVLVLYWYFANFHQAMFIMHRHKYFFSKQAAFVICRSED